jgi:hypothetical protein
MPKLKQPEATNSWKRTRCRLFLAVAAIILIGVIFLRFLPSLGLQKEIVAIRQAGLPTSPAELDQYYEPVAPSNNAALLVQAAVRSYVLPQSDLDPSRIPLPASSEKLLPELRGAVASHVDRNKAALDELHAIAEFTESRYPIDLTKGPSTLLPHLAEIKGLAQLLKFEAIHHSASGQRDLAVGALQSGFGLARTLRNEPLLISELVRIASVAIILDALERVVTEHQLTEQELKGLRDALQDAEADSTRGSFRAMVGERASGIAFFTMRPSELVQLGNSGGAARSSGLLFQQFAFGAQRLLGLRDRDLKIYLELMEGFANAVTNQLPEALAKTDKLTTEMDLRMQSGFGRLAILSRMLLPAFNKAVAKEAALVTRLRCADLALAVEEFRLAHSGALPNTVVELGSEFLRHLPRDVAVGQPLQYERRPTVGYRISSPAAGAKLKNEKSASFNISR